MPASRRSLPLLLAVITVAALLSRFPCPAPAFAQDDVDGVPLRFEGNLVLPDEVYTSVLELAAAATSSTPVTLDATARFVEFHLTGFLRASGYLLATVEANPDPRGEVLIRIDEGRLDRIIVVGQGLVRTLEVQLNLDLPQRVFNRFIIERQLAELVRRRSLDEATYQVVPMEQIDHGGIQLTPSSLLGTNLGLSPGAPHELLIRLKQPDWRTGFDLGIGFRSPDGFHGSTTYRDGSLLLDDDRTSTELLVAFRSFEALFSSNKNTGVTRVMLNNRWYGPPIFSDLFRPTVELDLQLQSRFRIDLNVDQYLFAPLSLALRLTYEPMRGLQLGVGGGMQFRKLFNVDPENDDVVLQIRTGEQTLRAFAEADLTWNFEPEELRQDRQPRWDLSARFISSGGTAFDQFLRLQSTYQRMFTIGYDEFWFVLAGAALLGDVPFYDEVALGDGFVRLGYGGDFFVRKAAGLNVEYRLSLSRESFKLSLFNDAAIFEELNQDRTGRRLQFTDSVGMGLHFLVMTTFQVNFYGGVGFVPGLRPVPGVSLQVTQAF